MCYIGNWSIYYIFNIMTFQNKFYSCPALYTQVLCQAYYILNCLQAMTSVESFCNRVVPILPLTVVTRRPVWYLTFLTMASTDPISLRYEPTLVYRIFNHWVLHTTTRCITSYEVNLLWQLYSQTWENIITFFWSKGWEYHLPGTIILGEFYRYWMKIRNISQHGYWIQKMVQQFLICVPFFHVLMGLGGSGDECVYTSMSTVLPSLEEGGTNWNRGKWSSPVVDLCFYCPVQFLSLSLPR